MFNSLEDKDIFMNLYHNNVIIVMLVCGENFDGQI